MLHPENINWLGVILATIAHGIIGFLWYGPIFGNAWMKALGKTRGQLMANANLSIGISSVGALIMAAAFALLLTLAPDRTITTGIIWGAVLGIGFAGTTKFISAAFEGVSWTVAGLFAAYEFVALIVMGAILTELK